MLPGLAVHHGDISLGLGKMRGPTWNPFLPHLYIEYGKYSKQKGDLKWNFHLASGPPHLMDIISIHFFIPLFFNIDILRLVRPLTAIFTIQPCSGSPQLLYKHNIKLKLCAKSGSDS